MSGRPAISAYTPSNTDPEVLKRIFVQREKLLERIVDRLSRSMTTGDKHHILLVGPRGSGKTHLVSLAAWDLQQREQLSDAMRIAWLGEDDSFTGLVHLAFGIASQLATEYPDEFPSDFKTPVRGLSQDDAALSVLNSVVEQLQDRSLILITENMDQTFRSLGDSGQKKWRAFLQETRKIATLATAQQLFAGVSDRKKAFFGFFDIQHMEPLSVEEAAELIARISIEQSKPELASYLNSAEGRFRIRALHYLAGGNHRMYVLLAEFLTKESLADLVVAFENLAHDMTPYFQERVRSLPDQQRQLVQCLCDVEGGLTVKQIAGETFIEERTCSKQLGNLKAKGYVCSEKRDKESYYDMAEPLMRLCLEVKNQRGRPLRMVARFLRAWFPTALLEEIKASSGRPGEYCAAALESGESVGSAVAAKLVSEIKDSIEEGEFTVAKKLTRELHFANESLARIFAIVLAGIDTMQGDFESSIQSLTTVIESPNTPVQEKAMARLSRGVAYGRLGHVDQELDDYSAVINMADVPIDQKAMALVNRSVAYGQQGDVGRAFSDYSAVINMSDAPVDQKAIAIFSRGVHSWRAGQFKDSAADFEAVLAVPAISPEQRTNALFAVVVPMVHYRGHDEIEAALATAFQEGDSQASGYGGTPHDLLWMVLQRSPSEWESYVSAIAPLYIEHRVGEKLGQGVTRSIQNLDEGGFSESQIDMWNDAWQQAGEGCEDLEIPLRCLDAAVEVMKSSPPTDRPLFQLPPEIRGLIRPLLTQSLGPSD